MKTLLRGLVYFGIVFGLGFLFGIVRVLWLLPRMGERSAELVEAPLMLLAMYLSARFVTRRFPVARRRDALASGLLALMLVLAMEFTVVLGLRGLSFREYLAERDPVAGAVYVAMLLIFAIMPSLVARRPGSP